MKSMTAFSRCEATKDWGSLNLEMRTVNHRYLDINLRLAEEIRFFEPIARQLIGDALGRGRIDMTIKYQSRSKNEVQLNNEVVSQLIQLQNDLTDIDSEITKFSVPQMLEWPGVLEVSGQDEKVMSQCLSELVAKALIQLQEQRLVEGMKIKQLLAQRVVEIVEIVLEIREILPEITTQFRENFQEKLANMEVEIDSHRLEQELVIFLGKQDIAEELDRLDVHIEQVNSILNNEQASGRRLDFLMQELNREANTLTSKSVDVRLNNASVNIKVLVEQMREQVQNIE